MGIQASMIYRPVITDAHVENALRIAQTKKNNTGYQSKAIRLVNYKVRQNREVTEEILDSMYPGGSWRV